MTDQLKGVFRDVACKLLAGVDIYGPVNRVGNGHEVTSTASFRHFFNSETLSQAPIKWFYFSDEYEEEFPTQENDFTFYDSRRMDPSRSAEWRFYYSGDFVGEYAKEGDLFVLARLTSSKEIIGMIVKNGSSFFHGIIHLLNLRIDNLDTRSVYIDQQDLEKNLDFVETQLLTGLGLYDLIPVSPDDEALMLEEFGGKYFTTRMVSNFARKLCSEVDPIEYPDYTLLSWLQRETQLFKAWEKLEINKKISTGFESPDDFIKYSLSIINRRKSRMGQSFENQLEALFNENKLKFDRTPVIDGKTRHRPDFIFPGKAYYVDENFESVYLTMLAAKSTSKERWRQVLEEANRIPDKHFCTLDPKITNDQIRQMTDARIVLVIPERIRDDYYGINEGILSVRDFLGVVRDRQRRARL
ncbi:MAG: type II restriction endonuclease [Anaerolineaceae bacterium]|nr:type II restriction endonuclease [Anaerolineaceae bacterium]